MEMQNVLHFRTSFILLFRLKKVKGSSKSPQKAKFFKKTQNLKKFKRKMLDIYISWSIMEALRYFLIQGLKNFLVVET